MDHGTVTTAAELEVATEELGVAQEELRVQAEALGEAQEALSEEARCYRDLFGFAPAAYIVTDGRGGTSAVQDPADALHLQMPITALRADSPQHVLPVEGLADLVARLAGTAAPPTAAGGERETSSEEAMAELDGAALIDPAALVPPPG